MGFDHISDINGYDHILFLMALGVGLSLWYWKKALWAVTAFTIGHSLTLALATFNIVKLDGSLAEFLIALTIFLAAIGTAIRSKSPQSKKGSWVFYGITLLFGLVHGLGFANFLGGTLLEGEMLWLPLLSFNIGVELGQLVIILAVLLINLIVEHVMDVKKSQWMLFSAGFVCSLAIKLIFDNKIW